MRAVSERVPEAMRCTREFTPQSMAGFLRKAESGMTTSSVGASL